MLFGYLLKITLHLIRTFGNAPQLAPKGNTSKRFREKKHLLVLGKMKGGGKGMVTDFSPLVSGSGSTGEKKSAPIRP